MMPLPWEAHAPLAWRLDVHAYASVWDKGIGAGEVGGRWNPVGFAVVYCSADPATAILEVAVHKGFAALDAVPHVMTRVRVVDVSEVHVVWPRDVPNPAWLQPGAASREQRAFGRALLERHVLVAIPSAVTRLSWNLLFNPTRALARYQVESQERFALDTRLNPPAR
jgi:RES domain-containing protein